MARTVRTTGTPSAPVISAALGGTRRSVRSGGDEKPARTGRATRDSGDTTARGRRTNTTGRSSDRETERSAGSTTRKTGRGFGAYKEAVAESRQEFATFRVGDETMVIAFLEDEPFSHVFRHWINRQPRNCIGDECPACERGDSPKPVLLFNVVDMSDPSKVLLWEASAEPAKRIEKRYDDLANTKSGALYLNSPGVYFEVSKTKAKNNFMEYSVDRIYDQQLEEWNIEPLTDEEREGLLEDLYTPEVVRYNTREELEDWLDGLDD